MQRQRPQEPSPFIGLRPSEGVLALLVVMVVMFVANAIAHPAFVREHLALTPGRALGPEPWQLVTSAFVHLRFGGLFSSAIVLIFFGTPLERYLGRNKFLQIFFLSTVGGSLAGAAIGRVWAPAAVLVGAGPAAMAMIAAFGVSHGRMPITLFGIQQMKSSTCALIFLGISAAMYLMNEQWLALSAALVGAGVGALAAARTSHFHDLVAGLRAYRQRLKKWRARRRYKVLSGGRDSRGFLN